MAMTYGRSETPPRAEALTSWVNRTFGWWSIRTSSRWVSLTVTNKWRNLWKQKDKKNWQILILCENRDCSPRQLVFSSYFQFALAIFGVFGFHLAYSGPVYKVQVSSIYRNSMTPFWFTSLKKVSSPYADGMLRTGSSSELHIAREKLRLWAEFGMWNLQHWHVFTVSDLSQFFFGFGHFSHLNENVLHISGHSIISCIIVQKSKLVAVATSSGTMAWIAAVVQVDHFFPVFSRNAARLTPPLSTFQWARSIECSRTQNLKEKTNGVHMNRQQNKHTLVTNIAGKRSRQFQWWSWCKFCSLNSSIYSWDVL
jgi:hypothetical protein